MILNKKLIFITEFWLFKKYELKIHFIDVHILIVAYFNLISFLLKINGKNRLNIII